MCPCGPCPEKGGPTAGAVFRRLCCTDEPVLERHPHQAPLVTCTRVLPAPGTLTDGVGKKHHQQEARVGGQHSGGQGQPGLRCVQMRNGGENSEVPRRGSVDKPGAHRGPEFKSQNPWKKQLRPCKFITQGPGRGDKAVQVIQVKGSLGPPAPVQPGAGAGVSVAWGPAPRRAPHPGRALQSHRYARPVSESFPPEASREKQSLSRSPLLPPRWPQWAGGDGMGGTARFEVPGDPDEGSGPLARKRKQHLPLPAPQRKPHPPSVSLFSLGEVSHTTG